MNIIQTSYKTKLPKEFSYPSGAEMLSRALEGVEQYDELEVGFYDFIGFRSDFQKTLKEAEPLKVLLASYRFHEKTISSSQLHIDRGWYDPAWKISIFAVPREYKSRIQNELLANGFNIVRDWLTTKRNDLWYRDCHQIALYYDLNRECINSK